MPSPKKHLTKEQRFEIRYKRILNNGTFTESEVKIVDEYIEECKATSERSFGAARKCVILAALQTFRNKLEQPYTDITIKDAYKAINGIKSAVLDDGEHYAANTLNNYIKMFKRFLIWLRRRGYNKNLQTLQLEDLLDIKAVKQKRVTHKPEDILSDEKIDMLIRACRSDRDRAFVSVLYHSAGRITEVLEARWSDLKADFASEKLIGYEFTLHGTKTAESQDETKPRGVYLPRSTAQLLNIHKNNECPNDSDYIFTSDDSGSEHYQYNAASKLMARLSKRVEFKAHCHLLRTSRITNWVKQGHGETEICMAAWGTPTSQMYNTYVILAGGYAAAKMKKKINADIGPVEETPVIKKPDTVKCWRCKATVSGHHTFCPECGWALDDKAVRDKTHFDKKADDYNSQRIAKLEKMVADLTLQLAHK